MNYRIAANVVASSLGDAVRIAVPTWRALSRRRIRKLATADTHDARDQLMRKWSNEVLRALRVDVAATGLEEVGPGPYLVAALHEGFVDVPVLLAHLDLPLTFVARAELADEKPISGFLEASHQILIRPEEAAGMRDLLRGAALANAQGRSVVVFPQGSLLGIEIGFQQGAWVAATQLGIPVLPVAIWGTHAVWDHPFSPLVALGKAVRLHVLPARRIEDEEQFRRLEREMKQVALAAGPVAPRRYQPQRDGFWDGYRFDIDPAFERLAAEVAHHRAKQDPLQRR